MGLSYLLFLILFTLASIWDPTHHLSNNDILSVRIHLLQYSYQTTQVFNQLHPLLGQPGSFLFLSHLQ